jgi:hypothetical protein
MEKIYSDDPNVPYKTTTLKALHTKSEIDGLFAKWGVKDVYWHYDPEHNEVYVQFKIEEKIQDRELSAAARVDAPIVWNHKTRKAVESVNWDISMRVMHWFLKSHLEAAYLSHSGKAVAFLPYIAGSDGKTTLKDIVIPRLEQIQDMLALTDESIIEKPEWIKKD